MKLYLLEHCWKNLPQHIFPEAIAPYYYILIMCEYTQTLLSEMYLIMCNAIVFQKNEAGQIEKQNESPGSYSQRDLFYVIYTNLGINAYICTGYFFVHFLFFNSIYEFIFYFVKSKICAISCQAKCKLSLDICFVSLSDCQCVLKSILSYPKH